MVTDDSLPDWWPSPPPVHLIRRAVAEDPEKRVERPAGHDAVPRVLGRAGVQQLEDQVAVS